MDYTFSSFSGCIANPLHPEPILEAYSWLNAIIQPDWHDGYLDRLMRYMILVYDPKSPLIHNERDFGSRRNIAAELAGFTESDEDFMTGVFTMTHDFFPELVVAFLKRFARSKEYAAIVVVENCFWESVQKLIEPISGKDSKAELEAVQKKSAIKDELDKDMARLEKYYKAFFGEDELLEKKAMGRMTPEMIARKTVMSDDL